MKSRLLTVTTFAALLASLAVAAEETNPIKQAMDFAHKAPKGEPKVSDKIIDGSAPEADVKKTLDLYKAMLDTKPPKGDQAAYKAKVEKLIHNQDPEARDSPRRVDLFRKKWLATSKAVHCGTI